MNELNLEKYRDDMLKLLNLIQLNTTLNHSELLKQVKARALKRSTLKKFSLIRMMRAGGFVPRLGSLENQDKDTESFVKIFIDEE